MADATVPQIPTVEETLRELRTPPRTVDELRQEVRKWCEVTVQVICNILRDPTASDANKLARIQQVADPAARMPRSTD